MGEERRRWRLRIDASEALIEFVSIVLAIVLATAVNEWRESVRTRNDTQAILVEIRQEIGANRAALRARHGHHLEILHAMAALEDASGKRHQTTYDQFWATFLRANKNGFMPFSGAATSWEVAQSSGLLRNVDFDTQRILVTAYTLQERVNGYVDRVISDVHVVPTGNDNVFYALSGFAIDIGDLTSNERNLLARYDDALRALDRVGIHDVRSARANSS